MRSGFRGIRAPVVSRASVAPKRLFHGSTSPTGSMYRFTPTQKGGSAASLSANLQGESFGTKPYRPRPSGENLRVQLYTTP